MSKKEEPSTETFDPVISSTSSLPKMQINHPHTKVFGVKGKSYKLDFGNFGKK
jgi:hypothetical protein